MEENAGNAIEEEEDEDDEGNDLAMLVEVSQQMASMGDLKKKKSYNRPENIKERMVPSAPCIFSRSLIFFIGCRPRTAN